MLWYRIEYVSFSQAKPINSIFYTFLNVILITFFHTRCVSRTDGINKRKSQGKFKKIAL